MTDKDSNKGQSSHSQITIAVISLIGIISTALFGNWDKLFPKSVPNTPSADVESQAETRLTEVKFNVYSQSYQPLEFVEIQFIFDGAPAPRYTDSNGYVSIDVPERKDIEVILRKDGFESKRQILNLQADPNRTITIYLKTIITSEAESDTQIPNSLPTTDSSTSPSASPNLNSQPRTTPSIQKWEFMGAASTGESVSVDTSSINKADEAIRFNYKIGNDLIAANADCDNNRWHADGYGWYSPQSQATQNMLDYVCEF